MGLARLSAADLPRATWLTFRRTYSSWAHEKGVPAKVVAQIMGHTKVDTTMNVYTQVLDGAARSAADRVGSELFRIVQIPDGTTTPTRRPKDRKSSGRSATNVACGSLT